MRMLTDQQDLLGAGLHQRRPDRALSRASYQHYQQAAGALWSMSLYVLTNMHDHDVC